MRVQQTRSDDDARRRRIVALLRSDAHYRELREAADALLREFIAIADYEHPAAVRYREVRSQAPDFGEGE